MSSSAFSLSLLVPTEGLEITAGEPVVGGAKSPELEHMFCGECMTWVFTRPAGMDFVNVRPTLLDEADWVAPFAETCAAERLPWAITGALQSFDRFPSPDELPAIVAAYAEWAGARGWPIATRSD